MNRRSILPPMPWRSWVGGLPGRTGLGAAPNQGLELTGNSVRSCLAPAIPRSSGLAFGLSQCKTPLNIEWVR
jgi:hypothetical protein